MGTGNSDLGSSAQLVIDEHAILNTLATHSRGVDRSDAALMKSAYHPDADVAYGIFSGDAYEFCDMLSRNSLHNPVSMHRHNNIWIRHAPGGAVSESYVIAYSQRDDENGPVQSLIGGRYLDRHAFRDDCWKLSHRTFVLEWNMNLPGSGSALPDYKAEGAAIGVRGPEDPSISHAARSDGGPAQTSEEKDMVQISQTQARQIEAALARTAIHNLIMAHCRAADRRDEALLKATWHRDATLQAGDYEGNALNFLLSSLETAADLKKMFHSVSNEWIHVDGDTAVSESYGIVFSTTSDDFDELTGRRYLDRFRNRDGNWKFSHRTVVQDWQIRLPSTDESEQGMYSQLRLRGGAFPDDPVYALWNSV